MRSQANIPGCLSSEAVKRKGDFVFQTGHVIEIVTKLFLVVQNATGKPPAVNISTQFDANFGTHTVTFQFKVIWGLSREAHILEYILFSDWGGNRGCTWPC